MDVYSVQSSLFSPIIDQLNPYRIFTLGAVIANPHNSSITISGIDTFVGLVRQGNFEIEELAIFDHSLHHHHIKPLPPA